MQSTSRRIFALPVVALAFLLAGCAAPRTAVSDVETAFTRPISLEPPGAINAVVTQATIGQTICVPNWTTTVRPPSSYTNGIKLTMLRDLGLPEADAEKYELDHFIPLALGGHPRDLKNLWLQPWNGVWGAHTKDRLEGKLKNLVCAGQLTLLEARTAIQQNWRAAFKRYVGATPTNVPPDEPVD